MGRQSPADEYCVEHLIGPGPGADHRPASFRPDAEWQWAEMQRLHATVPDLTFLGDWHTHPRASHGRLSRIDLEALAEILASEDTRADAIVSVLRSGGPRRWHWRAWEATTAARPWGKSKLSTR